MRIFSCNTDPGRCNQNLGMQDGYIEDFQVTSASEIIGKPTEFTNMYGQADGFGLCNTQRISSTFLEVSILNRSAV